MATITAKNVSKYYYNDNHWWKRRKKRNIETGVEDINLTIRQGEFVFVIGSCGSGKSTLLNLLSGNLQPDQGQVKLEGDSLTLFKRKKLGASSKTVGFVPQDQEFDRMVSVAENLELAYTGFFKKNLPERVQKVLRLVGLAHAGELFPGELTGGERRRLALGCALMNNPVILILDDITANQDPDSLWDLFLLLTEVNSHGTTVVMSVHNSLYVNMLRRRVITLVDGKIYGDVAKGRYGEVPKKKIRTTQVM